MWYIIIAIVGFGSGFFAGKSSDKLGGLEQKTDTVLVHVDRIETKTDTVLKYVTTLVPQIIVKQDTIIYTTGEVLRIVKKIDKNVESLIENK